MLRSGAQDAGKSNLRCASKREKIPDYAFDCHTQKGRRMGKTKAEFFRDEQAALEPFQPGLFDDLSEQ